MKTGDPAGYSKTILSFYFIGIKGDEIIVGRYEKVNVYAGLET